MRVDRADHHRGKGDEVQRDRIFDPAGIVAGPDGAMWFTDGETDGMNNSIGRITTAGDVTNYTDPSIDVPEEIVVGPDGALWFTNPKTTRSGGSPPPGTVTNYTGPAIDQPERIAAGPDGALWFTNNGNNSIGRITTSGVVTNLTGPGISQPWDIAAGPDGALWFTNHGSRLDRADHHVGDGRPTTPGAASTSPQASRPVPTGRCGSPTPSTTRSGGSPPRGK